MLPVLAIPHLFPPNNSDFHIMPSSPLPLDSGALLTIVNAKEGCSPYEGSQELGSHVKWKFEPFHPSKETHCERHSWVDVTACKEDEMIMNIRGQARDNCYKENL